MKNPNVIERRSKESIFLMVPSDISIELDAFSAEIYNYIDKDASFDELLAFSIETAAKYGIDMTSEEDFSKELETFIISLIIQGGLLCTKKLIFQPYNAIKDNDTYCLYFPYMRLTLRVTEALYDQIRKHTVKSYTDIFNIEEPTEDLFELYNFLCTPVSLNDSIDFHHTASRRIVMLPTTACNLKCEYCYAWREDKSIYNMTEAMAEAGIDFVASNAIADDEPSIDVSFMGGGEPTCNWNTLVHAVEYAKGIADNNQLPFSATLTTNGVLSDEKIDWIIQNINFIKISFDGVEIVQNRQRPAKTGDSFSQASYTMKRLSEANSNFLVRITVTNTSIEYLKESVEYIVEKFSPTSIIINPVYVCGSCASHGVSSIDFRTICSVFNSIQDLGINKHIDIVIPYDKVTYTDVPQLPFCGFQKGNCFLTPEGYLSACSEIDGCDDPRATIFFFGAWNEETQELIVNEEKEEQLHQISTSPNSKCLGCSNQNFCPGPCLVRRIDSDTLEKISKMRKEKTPYSSFSEDELDILLTSNHSTESIIQCNMTEILTEYQIKRILNAKDGALNNLAIETQLIDTSDLKTIGVIKAVSIKCKD